jgi:predicted phosphodiesterase
VIVAAVLADTHVRDNGGVSLPAAAWHVIDTSDIVLHAGDVAGQWLFNPGSATLRRRQPHRTMGVVRVCGTSVATELTELD